MAQRSDFPLASPYSHSESTKRNKDGGAKLVRTQLAISTARCSMEGGRVRERNNKNYYNDGDDAMSRTSASGTCRPKPASVSD